MDFNLKQLQAFVWVADLGSFRKAADRLNTTQPNISARISALEKSLDVVLLERDSGSVRLTPRGLEMLDHARHIIRASQQLQEMATSRPSVAESLRVGVTELIVHTWLRDFLRALKSTYPNVSVELTVDLAVNVERELAQRSIDLALQSGPCETAATGEMSLGAYAFIWVASPELGLHKVSPIDFDALSAYSILTHARNTQAYANLMDHIAKKSGSRPRVVPSTNLAACIHMTMEGLGAAAVPEVMVQDELERGDLVPVAYPWVPEKLEFLARFDAHRASPLVESAAKTAVDVANHYAS